MIGERRPLPLAASLRLFGLIVAGSLVSILSIRPVVVVASFALCAAAVLMIRTGSERRSEIALLGFIGASLLAPPLHGGNSSGTPILLSDLLIAMCAFALFAGGLRLRAGRLEAIFAGLTAAVALALIVSTVSATTPTSWRDLWILIRLAKYAVVLVVARELGRRLRGRWNEFWVLALVTFCVMALSGIAQYFSLFGVNSWLSGHYGGDPTLLLRTVYWRRAFGTIGNSNYFGFLCAVSLVLALWIVLTRNSVRSRLLALLVVPASTLSLFLSGSRAALLSLFVMIICLIGGSLFGRGLWRRAVVLACALVVAAPFALTQLGTLPLARRYFFIWGSGDPASRISLEQRRELWRETISRLHGHWLFGLGPDKGVLVQWVDNDFLRITREFGLVTALPFAVVLLLSAVSFARRLQFDEPRERAASLLGFVLVAGLAAFGLSADVIYQDQVMTVLLVLFGVLLSALPVKGGTPAP